MPKVCISILTYNSEQNIKNCLKSVFDQIYKDFEVIVVDNNSTDGTVEEVKKFSQVKIILNEENLGFAQGHNQAIRQSKSKYIFCLNDDVVLEPDYLEKLVNFLDKNSNIASAQGKLLRLTKKGKSDIIDSLGLKVFKSHKVVEIASGKKNNQFDFKEIFGVSGAAALYRKKSLEQIKFEDEYFDKDFFMYKEDVDLAYRLRWAGWSAWFLSGAIAYHKRTAKSESGLKGRKEKPILINRLSYRNHFFVLYKNLSPKIFFWYFPYIFFYEFKKFIYVLLFERKSLRSCKEFFKKLEKMREKRKIIMNNRKVGDKEIYKWFE